jgi:hypothetical protein
MRVLLNFVRRWRNKEEKWGKELVERLERNEKMVNRRKSVAMVVRANEIKGKEKMMEV